MGLYWKLYTNETVKIDDKLAAVNIFFDRTIQVYYGNEMQHEMFAISNNSNFN